MAEGIFLALFKVTAVADLAGPEKAVEWAREAQSDRRMLDALAAGTRRALIDGAELSGSRG